MSSFEFIDVINPHVPPPPPPKKPLFWPTTRGRLILVFEIRDDGIHIWGLDPGANTIPFHAELQPSQKDRFINAVKNGDEPEELLPNAPAHVGNDNTSGTGITPATSHALDNAIVIIDSGGDGPGPRYQLDLPTALKTTAKPGTLAAGKKGR